jgi:hypothetical protein
LIVDQGVEQVIRSDRLEWVPVFTGLSVGQFQELVRIVAGQGGEQTGAGRRWGLPLAERVLLTVVYYRTNLTFRQIALLFGISKSAANRIVEHVAPLLVLPDETVPPSPDTVLIVDGTLIPTYDRNVSASSKNYRYSVNMQVVIDANTRRGVAVGNTTPGNRHDSRAYRDSGVDQRCADVHVMADGAYQGNPQVIIPYRKPRKGKKLPAWKEDLNTVHKSVRARVETRAGASEVLEHPAQLPTQRSGSLVRPAGVVQMRNLTMTC